MGTNIPKCHHGCGDPKVEQKLLATCDVQWIAATGQNMRFPKHCKYTTQTTSPYPTENFKDHAKNNSFFARPSPFCLSPKVGPQFLLYHLRCFGCARVNSELAIKQAVLLDSEMLCTYKTPRRRRGANRNGEVYLQLASLTGSKFLLHM